MVKLNKRGYMQTLEAVIALIIILGVIIFSISLREPPKQSVPDDIRLTQEAIIGGLEYDQHLRQYIMESDGLRLSAIVIYSAILSSVPEGIKMGFSIDDDFTFPFDLHSTKKNVYADSVILANESGGQVRTFTVYLWHVDEEITSPCPIGMLGGSAYCNNPIDCYNELSVIVNNATVMDQIAEYYTIDCNPTHNCTMQANNC